MLPLQQAYVVMQSAIEYIKATFRFKDASVYNAFYKFVEYRDKAFIYTLCSSVNDRTMPQKNYLLTLRSLLYVAITRAQQKVLITGVGKKTEILQGL